jgi:hypothetical protein
MSVIRDSTDAWFIFIQAALDLHAHGHHRLDRIKRLPDDEVPALMQNLAVQQHFFPGGIRPPWKGFQLFSSLQQWVKNFITPKLRSQVIADCHQLVVPERSIRHPTKKYIISTRYSISLFQIAEAEPQGWRSTGCGQLRRQGDGDHRLDGGDQTRRKEIWFTCEDLPRLGSLMTFEILHGALMIFRRLKAIKGAQISTLSSLRILLTWIETIFAGAQFSDHAPPLDVDCASLLNYHA